MVETKVEPSSLIGEPSFKSLPRYSWASLSDLQWAVKRPRIGSFHSSSPSWSFSYAQEVPMARLFARLGKCSRQSKLGQCSGGLLPLQPMARQFFPLALVLASREILRT